MLGFLPGLGPGGWQRFASDALSFTGCSRGVGTGSDAWAETGSGLVDEMSFVDKVGKEVRNECIYMFIKCII